MHRRIWLLGLLLLCLCIAVAADDTTCSATKRCKNGCCNKSGNCGFGPDYCGTNCRSDCDRKSECNPGFGSKWAEEDKCPLNVCCSKHGYCGTTKDFCGSKKVKRPSCSKSRGVERVVGYFEGWARTRPCNTFWPEQIPIGLYTHINFAFATINPKTFLVEMKDKDNDGNLYERLTALKKKDPDLKIYLAIGGWAFNDPGKTATTFSELATSQDSQSKFINSLQSFMSQYDFDGLDLDWEYPVDKDRGGHSGDYKNFPKFMEKLKKTLDRGDKGLTITLPASYWYLRYFDIKRLEKTVDFFNIMSYDLHGAWDQKANWTEPYLNAHTNLTEIDLALDLLWRNDINPDNVVMGMGFYGRAFTVQTLSCSEPGCLFKDAGKPGECSSEAGILLNSEIDDITKKRGLKPKLYKEEAVKVLKWGNQWVSYDDEETLKMKTEFAQSRCLGGAMVWAISHDTKDAKYNKALAKVLGRKVTSGSLDDDEEAEEYKKVLYPQCRWTNCKETCPKGWVTVPRSDKRARKDEIFFDETGCGGDGGHTFCCPAEYMLPRCGWYGKGGDMCGKSNDLCPSGMVEVATLQIYCSAKQHFQAGCCTTDATSMKVYQTCQWGSYPDCDSDGECPGKNMDSHNTKLLAYSASGSGGGKCNQKKNELGTNVPGVQLQKYCCDVHDEDIRFEDCQIMKDVGPFPDKPGLSPYYCRSGCPPDRIRVAMDTEVEPCSYAKIGGWAFCCKSSFGYKKRNENPKVTGIKDVIRHWANEPTCPNKRNDLDKRSSSPEDISANTTTDIELFSRADDVSIDIGDILGDILSRTGSPDILDAAETSWDNLVEPVFPELTIRNIKRYLGVGPRWENEGPRASANRIVCNPHSSSAWILVLKERADGGGGGDDGGGGSTKILNCTSACLGGTCGIATDDLTKRHHAVPRHQSTHRHHWIHARQAPQPKLEVVKLIDPSGDDFKLDVLVPANPSVRELPSDHDGLENTADLPSGRPAASGAVPLAFFEAIPTLGELDRFRKFWEPIAGNPNFDNANLFDRLFECLGSYTNDRNFVVTEKLLNVVKGAIMQHKDPMAYIDRLEKMRDDPNACLAILRAAIASFDYMNTKTGPNVHGKMTNILADMWSQLVTAQTMWKLAHPDVKADIAVFFRDWLIDWYEMAVVRAKGFLLASIAEMRNIWEHTDDPRADLVLETLSALEEKIPFLHILTDWDYRS
ncbi:uncharacterized protein BKA55DRAFT_600509 [Fusarium redolens]|uniref:chitinase n=1 Tax=Fusarium redolens TaxID=48865 RepID=A0A9P9FVY8_FUSRE|nr:uncharacterized protein BKA55DRAFT_600509 [Fusarium redolens]KAH7202902.1 hypothetical protein BKA55DRAFT_600509 [Fusarium redolens]